MYDYHGHKIVENFLQKSLEERELYPLLLPPLDNKLSVACGATEDHFWLPDWFAQWPQEWFHFLFFKHNKWK